MQLFELFCTIGIKNDGFESGIAKAKNSALSFNAAAKTMMVGLGAAATAFGGLSVKALQLGGDLEQSIGGIQTLFKDSADAVVANAEKAYKTAGVDANNYMQQVTSFSASLLQSLGGDTEKAVSAADMAIIDMADNANKMGSSIESIQNAYQGFAKQNYMMLDNLKLGYGGTKTEMERLLADAEKLSGVKYDISNLNDVYQAIHVIQGELGITGTTAKEAAETLTGSFGAAKAAFSNFLSGAGGVDDVISSVSNLGKVVVRSFQELLPRLAEGLPKLFAELAPVTLQLLDTLLPSVTKGAVNILTGFIRGIIDNLPLLLNAGKQIIIALLEGIFGENEQINTAVNSIFDSFKKVITSVADIWIKIYEIFRPSLQKVWELVQIVFGGIKDFLDKNGTEILGVIIAVWNGAAEKAIAFYNFIAPFIETMLETIKGVFQGAFKFMQGVWDIFAGIFTGDWERVWEGIKGVFEGVWTAIKAVFSGAVGLGKNMIEGIWEGIKSMGAWILEKVKGFFGGIVDSVKGILGIASPSKVFAAIGGNVGEGFINGVESMAGKVDNAINDIFSGLNKNIDLGLNLNASMPDVDSITQMPTVTGITASSITSISPQNVNNSKLSDIVLAGLQDGFAMVSDTILDALPEIVQIYIDSGKVAESTFKALEESATRRNRMFAPTREQITAIARSAMPSFT